MPFIISAVLLFGALALATQVIFIRELMALLGGSELSIGIMLGAWLLWTGAGSLLFSRRNCAARSLPYITSALFILLAVLEPATITGIRMGRLFFGMPAGALPDLSITAKSAVLMFAPLCIVSGALFPLLGRVFRIAAGKTSAEAVGFVYIMECAGACVMGIALYFLLFPAFSNMELAFVNSFLCLICAALTAFPLKKIISGIMGALAAGFGIYCALSNPTEKLDTLSYSYLWQGYSVLESVNTPYGTITAIRYGEEVSIFENGYRLFTSGDRQDLEEKIHYSLLQHPNPESVLIIGGGMTAGMSLCLEHPSVRRVDYVEPDPEIHRLSAQYLEPGEPLHSPGSRTEVHHTDGRRYVKNTERTYSVIIINLPDPSNVQINRYYTREFFREALRILDDRGVISLSLSASENYINEQSAQFLNCIYGTMTGVFPEAAFIPGNTAHFFASNHSGVLLNRSDSLLARMEERGVSSDFVNRFFLPFTMSEERMAYFRNRVVGRPEEPSNTDLQPAGFFYQTVLWSTKFSPALRKTFIALAGLPQREFLIFAAVILLILLPLYYKGPGNAVPAAVFIVGLSQIGFELMLLIGFQIMFGYIYSGIAILLAGFMGGLAAGAWSGLRSRNIFFTPYRQLKNVQIFIAFFPAIILFPMILTAQFSGGEPHLLPGILFPVMMVTAGFLGGFHFQTASRIYLSGAASARLGSLYAYDLFGSCTGAILLSAVCIPILGLPATGVLLSALNLAAFWGLARYNPEAPAVNY